MSVERTNVITGMIALSINKGSVGSAIASKRLNRLAKVLMIAPPRIRPPVIAVENLLVIITSTNAMIALKMCVCIADKDVKTVEIGIVMDT